MISTSSAVRLVPVQPVAAEAVRQSSKPQQQTERGSQQPTPTPTPREVIGVEWSQRRLLRWAKDRG
jgi:hypothetical protein